MRHEPSTSIGGRLVPARELAAWRRVDVDKVKLCDKARWSVGCPRDGRDVRYQSIKFRWLRVVAGTIGAAFVSFALGYARARRIRETPGVTEGARYSFSPSRLCPPEAEQKAAVRNGKPDFSLRNQCCRRDCTSRRNPPSACGVRRSWRYCHLIRLSCQISTWIGSPETGPAA